MLTLYFQFMITDADFRKQSQMLACIEESEIFQINFTALLDQTSEEFETECQRIIGLMVEKKFYDSARKFAKISNVTADHVTICQV